MKKCRESGTSDYLLRDYDRRALYKFKQDGYPEEAIEMVRAMIEPLRNTPEQRKQRAKILMTHFQKTDKAKERQKQRYRNKHECPPGLPRSDKFEELDNKVEQRLRREGFDEERIEIYMSVIKPLRNTQEERQQRVKILGGVYRKTDKALEKARKYKASKKINQKT